MVDTPRPSPPAPDDSLPSQSPQQPQSPKPLTPRTYADLYALYLAAPVWQPDDQTAPASPTTPTPGTNGQPHTVNGQPAGQPTALDVLLFHDREILKALQGDVLGKDNKDQIKVYSECHRRSAMVPDSAAKLKFPHLLSIFGSVVRSVVSQNNEDALPGVYPISDVRNAIANLSGYEPPLSDEREQGSGIWPCEPNSLVLVNQNEAAEYDCGRKLTKIVHPRHKDALLAFDTGAKPWYDFTALSALLERANDPVAGRAWREQVVNDLYSLFGRWRWQGEFDQMILTGLVLATWVQGIWAWRPRVEIIGSSNTGKSMFCECLAGMFDRLSLLASDTTAAGLRQEICNRMIVVIVDEIDSHEEAKIKEQKKILEMARTATRGGTTLRGTGAQKSVKTTMRHLFWLFGITIDRSSQANWNRAVGLELLPPLPDKRGQLVLPPLSDLADLGQRSLAVAMWCAREAAELAVKLKATKIEGVDQRQVESYAVPAAMYWLAMGLGGPDGGPPEEVLTQMMTNVKADCGNTETDEECLIQAILRAKVRISGTKTEELSIGQAIERSQDMVNAGDTERQEWKKVLEQSGVKVDVYGHSKGIPLEWAMRSAIIFCYQTVKAIPLKGTRHQEQPIQQTLGRIVLGGIEAKKAQRRVGGVQGACVLLPLDPFLEKYGGVDGRQRELLEKGGF